MAALRFAWDRRKSDANVRKHGVSFAEAESVFLDDEALFRSDPDHSEDEDRFILMGMSARVRILVACHCYREDDTTIRIISARKADPQEGRAYARRRRR